MTQQQEFVRYFMLAAKQKCPLKPFLPDIETQDLRMDLINEETSELYDSFMSKDLVSIADAIGDLLYVVLGTAVACGIDIEPIFNEIHRSNMTKFIDGTFRADGKYVKGPSYSPANLAPIIAEQSK